MKQFFITFSLTLLFTGSIHAQKNVLTENFRNNLDKDEITRSYVTPVKVVWQSDNKNQQVKNPEVLLTQFDGQLSTSGAGMCVLQSDNEVQASVLLDFGTEIYGGIEIAAAIRAEKKPVRVRIRLGESVSEAMSDCIDNSVPGMNSATNDHSLRDYTLEIPWLGTVEVGNSGFRFVRIDLLDKGVDLPIRSVRGIFRYRDIPYLGSFKCDNERLNEIWETGAYTVHLNMQEYLWDGIKRDRLVWLGDIHPEIMTINTVFGDHEVVKKSLDFGRDTTPLPGWMNGISSYSLWWIIAHRDLYLYHGDLDYLKAQQPYLSELISQIISKIDKNGKENLDGGRFLDWPTANDENVIHSGLQSLTLMAMEAGKDIAGWLNDRELNQLCAKTSGSLRKHRPVDHGNKQAASLLVLAGILSPVKASPVILNNGANDFATFYGYYMLEALAKDGKYREAMDIISDYWGAMLDLGATTFWENFNYEERLNAIPIDQLPEPSKFNIHADGGDHCYIGLRASLCHGWASGPTTWLTAHVLGIQVVEPGSKVIRIQPNLGGLSFAEGTFPTPYGIVTVKHMKQPDGKVKSEIDAPKEIKVIR
ncbi:MAG: alpha-L-rhamnosidase C-terminal domain-containing protein [Proteiniphilum sp.]|uniref:alpha-L-rhamnosidase-related protein n=1 Tax=Proteiniphilum sp. TaxID=1926877 RepID=UPI002B203C9C|nr:alpha-L-rhamnosidase C-terminal domain-containing protein [Proteiniphilum sp.]MEA5127893.1 alpha-L-rhamnosidase C-terminal domain-containing protein [Proteiniphilum sp.]